MPNTQSSNAYSIHLDHRPVLNTNDIFVADKLGINTDTCIYTLRGQTININDDKWNLGQTYKYTNQLNTTIIFDGLPSNIKPAIKLYTIYILTTMTIKPSTIKSQIKYINYFISTIVTKSPQKTDIIMLTETDFNNFISNYSSQGLNTNTTQKMITALRRFIKFLNLYYFPNAPINDKYLKQFSASGRKNSIPEYNKTPNIDNEYFNKFLQLMVKTMDDKSKSYNYRATAACAIILSQTGLRISEIMALTDDLLEITSVPGTNEKTYMLNIRVMKDSRSQEFIVNKTFCTQLMVKAYTTLRDDISLYRLTTQKFLYQPDRRTVKNYPVNPDFFNQTIIKILAESDNNDFCFSAPEDNPYKYVNTQKVGDIYVAVPTTRQFRVHLCSELYYVHNVPLEFIRKFMCHLTTEMESYYVRPADNRHEEAAKNEKMLRELITGDTKLLGGRSKDITANLEKFLKAGKYNIKTDLDQIIEDLRGKIAIKAKRCGYCVKSSKFMSCKDDLNTNEMYCAFDVCPNLCSVYYMVPVSYNDYQSCIKTYQYCRENGHHAEASKELNKIKAICRQRLMPELNDMHARMQTDRNKILNEYPELEALENNYEEITKEIKKWQKMTYTLPQD